MTISLKIILFDNVFSYIVCAHTSLPRRVAAGLGAVLLASCGGSGGGSGTLAAEKPALVKFALSGTIATPVPDGVQLEDGKGNTVLLAGGDTNFKFNAGTAYLDAGTTYNVRVKAQPKGYVCVTEKNTAAISANVSDVTVRCNGPLTKRTHVTYVGNRADGSFGFQSLAIASDGAAWVRIAFELMRIDAQGKMNRVIILDRTTGAAMPDLIVRNVAFGPSGLIYLSVVRGADETRVLRLRATATENIYVADTLAESFLDSSNQSKNFGTSIGMSVDSADNVYVADRTYRVIRKISSTGTVTTFAGSGVSGRSDGTGAAATFEFNDYNQTMSHDAGGNLYIEESTDRNAIRKITSGGAVTTLAIPVGYRKMVTDKLGNLYFIATTSTAVPSVLRIAPSGVTDVLVSRGAVNFDTAPDVLKDNAIGVVNAMTVSEDGYIHIAGHNPMALYKIKIQ